MINVSLLKCFVAVVENESFTRAGSELFRSQSTVSMQIRRLEETLGSPVFNRDAKSLELSPQGEVLLGYARQILRLLDEARSAVVNVGHDRVVRLGCVEDYASRAIPKILVDLWKSDPDVRVVTSIDEPAELARRLGKDLDLIISMVPDGDVENVLRREQLVWTTSSMIDGIEKRRPVPLALRPENCVPCQYAKSALDAAGIAWQCSYLTSGIGTLHAAVEDGFAIGVFKESLVGGDVRCLGIEDGFPELPKVAMVMETAAASADKVFVRGFAARVLEHFS